MSKLVTHREVSGGPVHYAETTFGFEFGAATVSRLFSDERKGWVVMEVKTPKDEIQLYITRTGKLEIIGKDGRKR